jgi:hypothetical protein
METFRVTGTIRGGESGVTLVDGHVHFHACFDETTFFDAAYDNFAAAAQQLAPGSSFVGCLMFTESRSDHFYRHFRDRDGEEVPAGWFPVAMEDKSSMMARTADGRQLILVAGRQVVTAEGLEVLALGIDAEYPDGRSLGDTLTAVRESGALPVIPWGFGKWWFARGALLRGLIESEIRGEFFLGDNGGRLRYFRPPVHFRVARTREIPILPGSDPLPFQRENRRAGSYGFALPAEVGENQPTDIIKRLIRDHDRALVHYGQREGLTGFCRNQIAMQITKRNRP